MAETYGFFDSENHDRPYTSAQMSQYFQGIVTNGVFDGIGENLVPYISGPYVKIPSGRAVVDCHWYNNDDTVALVFPISSSVLRCTLVLVCDYTQRMIYPEIRQGSAINLPDVTDTEDKKYLKLAHIQITTSTASITKVCIGDETPLLKNLTEYVVKEDGKSLSTNDFTDEYKSQIDTNTSDIDNLKSRADAVDVNVSDLSDKVKQNTADTEELKNKTDATDEVVGHLSKSLQNAVFKSNVDTELNASSENPVQNKAVTVRVEGLNSQVTQLQGEVKTNTDDISTLKTKVTKAETDISTLNKKADATDEVVAHLSESLQNAVFKSSIDTELSTTSENPVQNKVVSASINSLTASVNYMSEHKADTATVNGIASDVSKLEESVAQNKTDITALQLNKQETDLKLNNAITNLGNLEASVSENETNITALQLNKQETDLKVNNLITNFGGLEADVSGIDERVGDLEDAKSVQLATNISLNSMIEANAGEIGILKGTLGFEGKNKFNNTTSSTTVSGVTFTVNSDGTITANGTATANITFQLKPNLYIQNNGWAGNIFSFGAIETNKNYRGLLMYYNSNWTLQNSVYLNSTEAPLLDYYCAIACIYVVKGTTLNDVLFEPMLRDENIEDDTYSSYGGLNVIKRFEKFSNQKLLYSKTTSSASPLTVNVSNLFTGYSAAVCNVVTTGDKYSIILPLQYIKSLGTSVNYEADDLLFTYVDNSNIQIRTGLASSNPTINSVNIIGLY